jgi:hypothetical protein
MNQNHHRWSDNPIADQLDRELARPDRPTATDGTPTKALVFLGIVAVIVILLLLAGVTL